jgi:hypothetical protein
LRERKTDKIFNEIPLDGKLNHIIPDFYRIKRTIPGLLNHSGKRVIKNPKSAGRAGTKTHHKKTLNGYIKPC